MVGRVLALEKNMADVLLIPYEQYAMGLHIAVEYIWYVVLVLYSVTLKERFALVLYVAAGYVQYLVVGWGIVLKEG